MFTSVLTKKDKAIIRRELKKGKSYCAIARMIKPARSTVQRYCYAKGIQRKVSRKVIVSNRRKAHLFKKAFRICIVCDQEYRPRYDARTDACGLKCAGVLRRGHAA